MILQVSRGLQGLSLLALLGGCAPSLNWREVHPPESQGLMLMFPCKPEHHERSVLLPGVDGGAATVHLLSCEADGATWALSYLDAGTPQRWLQALPALSAALRANISMGTPALAPSGSQRELGPTAVPGMTPHPAARTWWLQGQRPISAIQHDTVHVQAWHFSKGLSVFQASVWAPTLQEGDPRLNSFSSSFNFLP
jgi:hypothetical protein